MGVAAAVTADVVADDTLFAVFGSLVLIPAVMVAVTLPVGTVGTQFTVAPLGNRLIAHIAATAALGPLLVHVNVPLTVEPGEAVAGNADVSVTSALADTLIVASAELLVDW